MKAKTKKENISLFVNETETTITIKIPCSFCGAEHEHEATELDIEQKPMKAIEQEAAKGAYDAGFRYSSSNILEAQGIMCTECFKNRNNKNHWV